LQHAGAFWGTLQHSRRERGRGSRGAGRRGPAPDWRRETCSTPVHFAAHCNNTRGADVFERGANVFEGGANVPEGRAT